MSSRLPDLRMSYDKNQLDEELIEKNPIMLFDSWFKSALNAEILEPNAMTLATADSNARPTARMVLLKDFDDDGFVFYTNYKSRKGLQLEQNPFAALVIWWGIFARQVRIEGSVEKVSVEESDDYFYSRPRGHQLGTSASNQSQIIPNYEFLEKQYTGLSKQFEGKQIPRPDFWGGYRLKPEIIEFWQGRLNRLHDRLRYTKKKSGGWNIDRLAP